MRLALSQSILESTHITLTSTWTRYSLYVVFPVAPHPRLLIAWLDVNTEVHGYSITVDFLEKDFYSSYTHFLKLILSE